MKSAFQIAALAAGVVLAICEKSNAQTAETQPPPKLHMNAKQVERMAIAARNANRLLGSLLQVQARAANRRFVYYYGTWWYWMPEGYWAVWDGESWRPYQP